MVYSIFVFATQILLYANEPVIYIYIYKEKKKRTGSLKFYTLFGYDFVFLICLF